MVDRKTYLELLTAYQAALDLLDQAYADSTYSFDIREQLIEAYAEAGRDIPDRHGEGMPRNAEQLADRLEAEGS